METIKKILVGYDFSECSKKAVLEAAHLAKKLDAEVYLVHVLDAEISEVFAAPLRKDWSKDVLKNVHDDLKNYEEEIGSKINIKDAIVEIGTPYRKIIKHAIDLNADIVIVGSHSRTAVGYALLGSVADKVARFSPVPAMICRTDRSASMAKVLVPIDQSEESERAIPYAKRFAELYNSKIELFHAVDIHEYYNVEYKNVFAKSREQADDRLMELTKVHAFSLDPIVIEGGPSHSIIHQIKEDEAIGLVVMMTHGHKGLKQFFLGRTTEAVCRYAPCNVITVPTEEHSKKMHSLKEHFEDEKVTIGNVLI